MRKMWLSILTLIISITGYAGIMMYVYYRKESFSSWFMLPSLLMTLPATLWWSDYFEKLFKIKDK